MVVRELVCQSSDRRKKKGSTWRIETTTFGGKMENGDHDDLLATSRVDGWPL